MTPEQLRKDYYNIHVKHRVEKTPITHPELFDPSNPPEDWHYDEWHAFWYQIKPWEEMNHMERYWFWYLCVACVIISLFIGVANS